MAGCGFGWFGNSEFWWWLVSHNASKSIEYINPISSNGQEI